MRCWKWEVTLYFQVRVLLISVWAGQTQGWTQNSQKLLKRQWYTNNFFEDFFFLMQQCTLNYNSACFISVSWISCSTPVWERHSNIYISMGSTVSSSFLDNKGTLHCVLFTLTITITLYISLSLGKLQTTFCRQEESFKKCEVSLLVSS